MTRRSWLRYGLQMGMLGLLASVLVVVKLLVWPNQTGILDLLPALLLPCAFAVVISVNQIVGRRRSRRQ